MITCILPKIMLVHLIFSLGREDFGNYLGFTHKLVNLYLRVNQANRISHLEISVFNRTFNDSEMSED